ncbi:MAG: DUF4350 domain-containing protein, partial [Pseudomonadota bacterium]
MKKEILISYAVVLSLSLFAARGILAEGLPQRDDPDFNPPIDNPAYSEGEGPLVVIDAAHHNFNTIANGKYRSFAELLERDGYVVEGSEGLYTKFTEDALENIDVLVIVNALNEANVGYEEGNWKLPTPSAFEDEEIKAVKNWVMEGGSLMLVADHLQFPGGATDLADALGFSLSNSYVMRANSPLLLGKPDHEHNMIKFQNSDGSLKPSPILKGREGFDEAVDLVVSFTGEAFWIKPQSQAKPLLSLPEGTVGLLPSVADGFSEATPTIKTVGMLQGATLQLGDGKVAMFGEASMFSAQLSATPPEPSWEQGMNNPAAPQNFQFALNVLHWLSGLLPTSPPDCVALGESQPTIIDQDLNVHIPCAIYQGPFVD